MTFLMTFCLGAIVGMTYVFACYEYIRRKHDKKDK